MKGKINCIGCISVENKRKRGSREGGEEGGHKIEVMQTPRSSIVTCFIFKSCPLKQIVKEMAKTSAQSQPSPGCKIQIKPEML